MKITYRPEIDGLRAIAVGAVILYHAQITILGHQTFKGGFIGVDIFFVISGYLITSIILKELVTTGSFSFKHFYERRIRRILPLLLFVMLVSLPFAWIYLLPSSFIDFSKSILSSLGFSSNFYFWYYGQQYGAESGLLKPFLHTWSLSVEEQYYILFPIILLVTFKYFKKYLIHILILGFLISLGLADWGSRNHPYFNFYFLPTRVWELLAGSILAYFEITKGHRSKYQTLNLILPSIGLFLIGYSILLFNDKMFHPSFYTLIPIIGVCLIIWFSNKDELITKILSSKLLVGIGLISYSLYLWHYPIFAFSRITDNNSSEYFKIEWIILIITLSIISYYLVEKPFRKTAYNFKLLIIRFILPTILSLTLFNFFSINSNGYENRMPNFLINDINFELNLKNILKYQDNVEFSCNNLLNFLEPDNFDYCNFNSSASKKVFSIGDSHMSVLNYDLKERIVNKNFNFISSTYGGCLFYPGFDKVISKTNKSSDVNRCTNSYFEFLTNKFRTTSNSIFIFGGRFPLHFENSFFDNKEGGKEGDGWHEKYYNINNEFNDIKESFIKSISRLSQKNYIVLIYPIPEVGRNVPKTIFKNFKENYVINKLSNKLNYFTTSYEVYKERTKSSFEVLDIIKGDKIYRVYPHKLFCNTIIKDRCITHDEEDIFYVDDDHPSLRASQMINDLIMKEIEKIELKSN